ncbi:hypothetical protein RI129_003525 [Pyrocoelia pectoralis]|uniref:Uncharacterized protein n=1 Tax=Pyrocoelia pectoralis TaxID=417401 RepID=A0AAN7VQN6_9COLE
MCEYVNVNYHKLLFHSKTRWLSLFPAIERILKMYVPLKEYFLALPQPPVTIKTFFENEMGEMYLIEQMERENNSVLDINKILQSTLDTLRARSETNFLPVAVRKLLSSCSEEKREAFKRDTKNMYENCISYLVKFTQIPKIYNPQHILQITIYSCAHFGKETFFYKKILLILTESQIRYKSEKIYLSTYNVVRLDIRCK